MHQATIVCGEYWPKNEANLKEVRRLTFYKDGVYEHPVDLYDQGELVVWEILTNEKRKYNVLDRMTIDFHYTENVPYDCTKLIDAYKLCRYDDTIIEWEYKGNVPVKCFPTDAQIKKVRLNTFSSDDSKMGFFSRFGSLKELDIYETTFPIEALMNLTEDKLETLKYNVEENGEIQLIDANDVDASTKSDKIFKALRSVTTLEVKPCPLQLAIEAFSKLQKLGKYDLLIDGNEIKLTDTKPLNKLEFEVDVTNASIWFTGEFDTDLEKIMPPQFKFTMLTIHLENVKYANEKEIMAQVWKWLKVHKHPEVTKLMVCISKKEPGANQGLQEDLKTHLPSLNTFTLSLVRPKEPHTLIQNDPLGDIIKAKNPEVTFTYVKG